MSILYPHVWEYHESNCPLKVSINQLALIENNCANLKTGAITSISRI